MKFIHFRWASQSNWFWQNVELNFFLCRTHSLNQNTALFAKDTFYCTKWLNSPFYSAHLLHQMFNFKVIMCWNVKELICHLNAHINLYIYIYKSNCNLISLTLFQGILINYFSIDNSHWFFDSIDVLVAVSSKLLTLDANSCFGCFFAIAHTLSGYI